MKAKRRRALRVMTTAILTLLVAYLAILAALAIFQSRLVYPAPARAEPLESHLESIRYTTEDGLELRAGYAPARGGQPTLVFFHGNGANWHSTAGATELLAARGYGVLAAEYRGYDGNPGAPSEAGLYRDGRAALGWLRERGVAERDIVLAGHSIGSGVAVQLATEMAPRALVLIAPLASLPRAVRGLYWWVPARLLLRDSYDNIAKLAEVNAPVLVLHGEEDRIIPAREGQALARSGKEAEIVLLPERGHNLPWDPEVQQLQLRFLESLAAPGD